jgi:formylglycine-generating enzyme required for sulfatase activity
LPQRTRFRVACAIAAFDTSATLWSRICDETSTSLLIEPAAYSTTWINALAPAAPQLRDSMRKALASAETLESARTGALALYEFDNGQMQRLVDVLVSAQGHQYRAIVEQLRRNPEESLSLVRETALALEAQTPLASEADLAAAKRANLIVASFELGDRSLLREASKLASTPQLRTQVIHTMSPDCIDLAAFVPLILESHGDQSLCNVAMLAAWHHLNIPISLDLHDRLSARLLDIYRSEPDPEAHSTGGLLLRKLGVDLTELDAELAEQPRAPSRNWYVNKSAQTMVVLRPDRFQLEGYVAPQELNYAFAISTTEIRLDDFREFKPDHTQDESYHVSNENIPAAGIFIFRAAKYCNWLSNKEGIPEEDWCYPPDAQITEKNCYPVSRFETKAGYRLPLSSEWEFACRAGSTTSRFFGEDVQLMKYYGWHRKTSDTLIHPVAELLPNPFGLFDMYGNVSEPCIANRTAGQYVVHGESSYQRADFMNSSAAPQNDPQRLTRWQGFRVVRRLKE